MVKQTAPKGQRRAMKSKIMNVLVGMAIPVLLLAWGNDIVIDTMRRSNNQYPVSYDIIWPKDTNMIVSVGYNQGTDSYVKLYQSTDAGQTWNNSANISYPGHNLRSVQLKYYEPYGLLLWLTEDGELWMVVFDLQALTYVVAVQIGASSDSVVSASFSKAVKNDTLTLYVAYTSRNSTYDILKIYRSINWGSFQTVDSVRYSNSSIYYTYRDIDAALRNDTIKVYATVEYLDRSTNKKDHYLWIFNDKPDRLFYYTGYKIVENDPSIDSKYPSLSVASGGYLICLYEVDGNIKYIFSNDYGNSVVTYDFNFNYADSIESTPVVIPWSIPPYFRGFNTLFTRNNRLYFVEASCSGGGMSWGTPVLVSDEHPYYTYILRDVNSYLPGIANRYDMSIPAVVWARDFVHFSYPFFFYDSTYFCVDNMTAVGVFENNLLPPNLNFTINTISKGTITLHFGTGLEESVNGMILSTDGRIVKKFEINKGIKEYTIETSELPTGIYFINVKGSKTSGLKKFIVTK